MTQRLGKAFTDVSASSVADYRESALDLSQAPSLALDAQLPLASRAGQPTNQDIIDATRKVYEKHFELVDLFIDQGKLLSSFPDRVSRLRDLNKFDWKGYKEGRGDSRSVIAPLRSDEILAPAFAAAEQSPSVITTSLGVAVSAQLLLGGEGGIGGVNATLRQPDGRQLRGTGWLAGKLGLAAEISLGLQIGLYFVDLDKYAGPFLGAAIGGEIALGGSFAALFSPDLKTFYGLSIGIGIGLGAAVTVMGGYTWVF